MTQNWSETLEDASCIYLIRGTSQGSLTPYFFSKDNKALHPQLTSDKNKQTKNNERKKKSKSKHLGKHLSVQVD